MRHAEGKLREKDLIDFRDFQFNPVWPTKYKMSGQSVLSPYQLIKDKRY